MYELLPSTRFLCEKAEKSGTAENERNKSQKAEEVATLDQMQEQDLVI